jgi:hypothetical protein
LDKWLQIGLNLSPNFILVVQAVLLLAVAGQGRIASWLEKLFTAETGHGPVKEGTGHSPVKERKAL